MHMRRKEDLEEPQSTEVPSCQILHLGYPKNPSLFRDEHPERGYTTPTSLLDGKEQAGKAMDTLQKRALRMRIMTDIL